MTDYDSPWKEALEIYFRAFLALFFPNIHADIDRAFHIGRLLEVGTVNINGADSRGPDHFPFMGCKSSGMLTQGIHYSISAMTRDRRLR